MINLKNGPSYHGGKMYWGKGLEVKTDFIYDLHLILVTESPSVSIWFNELLTRDRCTVGTRDSTLFALVKGFYEDNVPIYPILDRLQELNREDFWDRLHYTKFKAVLEFFISNA